PLSTKVKETFVRKAKFSYNQDNIIFKPSTSMQNSLTRLSGSLKGILMGVILFVASIGILYWNEGRVDISGIANDATRISATEQSTETDGQLVSLSGTIETQGAIGDLYL